MKFKDITSLQDWVQNLFENLGLNNTLSWILTIAINIVVLFFLCWFAYLILRRIILSFVKPWVDKSENSRLNVFLKRNSFDALAHLASGFLFYFLLPVFFKLSEGLLHTLRVLAVIYIIVMILISITRILHSLEYLARFNPKFEKKPVGSYVQVILILAYLFAFILIISILFSKNPLTVIGTLGAGAAILMLVFKDLILGLVASVQVSVNDMVRVGDWIVVDAFEADGIVEEINLTTVQVRNWDGYLANVPTYSLVSQGFDNVRERDELGRRRLMHHLLLDIQTIKEVDETFISNLREKELFKGDKEDLKWTDENEKDYDFDKVTTITNLSLFRRYMEAYITDHPGIDNYYLVVRQLQQEGNGLPIEVYGWVKSVSFKPLNYIQSDIFEHFYTIMQEFDLALYQNPSGDDIKHINPESNKNQDT